MVWDGRERELPIHFSALPTSQNKGHKPLPDHGVKTPTLLSSKFFRGFRSLMYRNLYSRSAPFPKIRWTFAIGFCSCEVVVRDTARHSHRFQRSLNS
jgi:hypothetical protein